MNIQLNNWEIANINYSHFDNEIREDNSFSLRFKKVFKNKEKNNFKIVFFLNIEDKNFDLNIDAVFSFTTDEKITEDFKQSHFPRINAPAIAYPYLRAYVSNLTLQSGTNPVMLPTINFVKFKNPDD